MLWFTSLVFSLDAALFGMLAKQWCREYLRWHSVNTPPRQNVLLRQVRFEAWERWGVASIIAAVPALLQIALVLFLVGLQIFVLTFTNKALAVVVSLAIGSTLIGVVVLTVLPVFYRLCPFQSPTGWACVHLPQFLRSLLWFLVSDVMALWMLLALCAILPLIWLSRHLTCLTTINAVFERLLDRCADYLDKQFAERGRPEDWRKYNLSAVNDPALCKLTIPDVKLEEMCKGLNINLEHACVDVVQTQLLIRALTWVRQGSSNDANAHTAVLECVPSIHAATTSTWHTSSRPPFLSSIISICPTDLCKLREMARSYFYEVAGSSLAFCPLADEGFPFKPNDLSGPFVVTRLSEGLQEYSDILGAWESDPVTYDICHALVRTDLLALIDDWVRLSVEREFDRSRESVAELIVFLLCLLRIIPSTDVRDAVLAGGLNFTGRWVDTIEEAFRRLAPHGMAYWDGLVPIIVQSAHLLGPVAFDNERGERRIISKFALLLN